jgi:hypothetical protein
MTKGKMTEEEKQAWWAANKRKAEAKRKQAEERHRKFVEESKRHQIEYDCELVKWHGSNYGN